MRCTVMESNSALPRNLWLLRTFSYLQLYLAAIQGCSMVEQRVPAPLSRAIKTWQIRQERNPPKHQVTLPVARFHRRCTCVRSCCSFSSNIGHSPHYPALLVRLPARHLRTIVRALDLKSRPRMPLWDGAARPRRAKRFSLCR